MKRIAIVLAAVTMMAGCTTSEKDAAVGAAVGGAVGAVATGRASGALIGAGIGAVSGVVLGRATRKGYCVYRNPRTGRRYTDVCPAGY